MDTADLHSSVDDLSNNIDDLEESLAPLLKTALAHSTSKLPLLDKAKLYVLVTYAIESMLFSCLRLNGVEAKSHPVFQELTRVKEYFSKIKTAETAGTKRSTTLDKEAASRFIKHGLAGNERYDHERQQRMERERAGAKRKFDEIQVGTHTRFESTAKRIKKFEDEETGTGKFNGDVNSGTDGMDASVETTDAELAMPEPVERSKAEKKEAKRQRRLERRQAAMDSVGSSPIGSKSQVDQRVQETSGIYGSSEQQETYGAPNPTIEALESLLQGSSPGEGNSTPIRKKKKRKSKAQKLQDDIADEMK